MATWEDGPEYAPRERPQHYAEPPAPPLEQAPAAVVPPPLPDARPGFAGPLAPVAPLETLVPTPADQRDPSRPFDTVTTTLTTAPASTPATTPSPASPWGPPIEQPYDATRPLGPVPAPARGPAPSPPWPLLEHPAPAGFPAPPQPAPGSPQPYGYPAPGTPGWFAPPPTAYGEQQQQQPGRVDAKRVVEGATPGLCICLALGGVVYVLAPVMLVVAVVLSTRVQVAQQVVRTGFRVAAGVVVLLAVVGLFRFVVDGEPWWSFVAGWSAALCWVALVGLLGTIWRALRRPTPPARGPWG